MTLDIQQKMPACYSEFKRAIYQGQVFILPASSATLSLIQYAKSLLTKSLNTDDLQQIHRNVDGETLFNRLSEVRSHLYNDDITRELLKQVLETSLNIDRENTVCDPFRLRFNPPSVSYKAGIYNAIHRDTWFANPECQINLWVSLFDAIEEQTFNFFPHFFTRPIANSSQSFDFTNWSQEVGFQSHKKVDAKYYPTVEHPLSLKSARGFSCKEGEIVIFSASQLHQTAFNQGSLTRFSLDFRLVDLKDKQQGRGAPNVDNCSTGDAAKDYIRLI